MVSEECTAKMHCMPAIYRQSVVIDVAITEQAVNAFDTVLWRHITRDITA